MSMQASILLAWRWRRAVREGVEAAEFDAGVYALRREPHLARRIEHTQVQARETINQLLAE